MTGTAVYIPENTIRVGLHETAGCRGGARRSRKLRSNPAGWGDYADWPRTHLQCQRLPDIPVAGRAVENAAGVAGAVAVAPVGPAESHRATVYRGTRRTTGTCDGPAVRLQRVWGGHWAASARPRCRR